MAIPKGVKANYEILCKAATKFDLGVLECQDKKTKNIVYVLVAISHNPRTGETDMMPLAKMFEGDPYEEVNPPDPDNPEEFLEDK